MSRQQATNNTNIKIWNIKTNKLTLKKQNRTKDGSKIYIYYQHHQYLAFSPSIAQVKQLTTWLPANALPLLLDPRGPKQFPKIIEVLMRHITAPMVAIPDSDTNFFESGLDWGWVILIKSNFNILVGPTRLIKFYVFFDIK